MKDPIECGIKSSFSRPRCTVIFSVQGAHFQTLSVPTFWDFIIIITLSSPSSSLPPVRLSEQWGCLWAQAFGETLPHSRHYSRQSQACGNASQVATPLEFFYENPRFLSIGGLDNNLLRGKSIDSFNREWVFCAHPEISKTNQILCSF